MANEPYIEVYKRFCKLAAEDDSVFKIFKSHPDYIPMLEHVSTELGFDYLEEIKRMNPEILGQIEKFRKNDTLGSPKTSEYRGIGIISPTTLRYIKILCDMIEMFGTLNDETIIELGGGYGGQCKIISDIFTYKSYTIIDLPEVVSLTNRYLKENNVPNAKAITIDEIPDSKWGLFISNYAFTELPAELQLTYIEKVIRKCSHAYITCNFCGNPSEAISLPKSDLLKEFVCIELDEIPKTHANNCLLVW